MCMGRGELIRCIKLYYTVCSTCVCLCVLVCGVCVVCVKYVCGEDRGIGCSVCVHLCVFLNWLRDTCVYVCVCVYICMGRGEMVA